MELFPEFDYEAKPEPVEAPKIDEALAKRLIDKALSLQLFEPWRILSETDLIGIRDPETQEMELISILGGGSEVFAIQLYQPPENIEFWQNAFRGVEPEPSLATLLSLRLLECETIAKPDAELADIEFFENHCKKKDKKSRHKIPAFRSYRPGFSPWFIEQHEAEKLCLMLDMVIDLTEEIANTKGAYDKYYQWGAKPDSIHRIPIYELKKNGDPQKFNDWRVKKGKLPKHSPEVAKELPKSDPNLAKLLKLPVKDDTWELGAIYLPEPIQDGGRPYFAKQPLCMRRGPNTPIAHKADFYGGDDQISDTEAIRETFTETAIASGYLPQEIIVGSETGRLAILELAEQKDIDVNFSKQELILDFYKFIQKEANNSMAQEAEQLIESLPADLKDQLMSGEMDDALAMLRDMISEQSADNVIPVDFSTRSSGKKAASPTTSSKVPTPKGETHFSVRVSLVGVKDLYRTFTIPTDATFFHLHMAIQSVFDWDCSHLFDFQLGKRSQAQSIGFDDAEIPVTTKLCDIFSTEGNQDFPPLHYLYDYGDDWLHKVTIRKKVLTLKKPNPQPVVKGGKGIAPDEDSGGISGYLAMIEGNHWVFDEEPEYKEAFLSKTFDPDDVEFPTTEFMEYVFDNYCEAWE